MSNRRSFLREALGLGAGMFAAPRLLGQEPTPKNHGHPEMPAHNVPSITPDVGDMPYTLDNGVKVFHLVAEVVRQRIAPNKTLDLWGFNGSAPGPTFQVTEGDRVRVVFDNHLPEPCSIHWHGFETPIANDGMPGVSQDPVLPGGRFVYEFDIHQHGTYFYHSHMAMQEMAGMLGAFIMHPRVPYQPHCDKDFVLHFQEYAVLPNATVPNTMSMEYNWLVINGKSGPAATPLIIRQGDRVRIRMINLGMDHHPIHLHGNTFEITGTEGGRIQPSAWWPGNTVLVGVAQARDVEFVAKYPGDWMLHCHLPHHMMNQMSSQAGTMTRTAGMPTGNSMNNGMGMLDGSPGAPMGDGYGPSLGRGMGGSDNATTNGPLSTPQALDSMQGMMQAMQTGQPAMSPLQMHNAMAMNMEGMRETEKSIAPDANRVPNFPQDAYMESPMMNMERDPMLHKPEFYGLRPGWSSYFQGMMTFVRVLPAAQYEDLLRRMRETTRPNDPYASILNG